MIILAALHDSHLTPPTSDHQSGDDNSVCNVEVNSLAQCLSRTRELTRSLTKRIETDHEVGTVGTYHFNRLSVQLKKLLLSSISFRCAIWRPMIYVKSYQPLTI